MPHSASQHYDVVIIGAGLAGLSLARHLLMYSDKTVLLLEKRPHIPPPRQKVGESNVQVQGYYLGKVLDLEEHLLRDHTLKYNLRFCWPTPGRSNQGYQDYSQSYIRFLSNIFCYQLDRNKIEAELLRLNRQDARFSFQAGVSNLDVALATDSSGHHAVTFEASQRKAEIQATWIVDTTGRARFLARRLGLAKPNPIRHGSVFFWVDGLVNVEKLTDLSHSQMLLHENRRKLGHTPAWLATNHFSGEGYWFWVIPLRGKTSLGLVYDRERVNEAEVSSPEKVIEWIGQRHPLLARDLPQRKILDQAMFRNFSYDCRQTISSGRWALAGEAGRFSDPLYSPGGDLISLHNTLIVDAICTGQERMLALKSRLYELLMWTLYEAYVPSFAVSYDVLGDQECFAMKYAWELTVYFTFYVFPFINQRFTDAAFVASYLDLFARLGRVNRSLQAFLTAYYHWKKKAQPVGRSQPVFFDFMSFEPLKRSEELLYQVGLSGPECVKVLQGAMANIERLARFIAVYIYSAVVGEPGLVKNLQLGQSVVLDDLRFDPDAMRRQCSQLHPAEDAELAATAPMFLAAFAIPAPSSPVDSPPTHGSADEPSRGNPVSGSLQPGGPPKTPGWRAGPPVAGR